MLCKFYTICPSPEWHDILQNDKPAIVLLCCCRHLPQAIFIIGLSWLYTVHNTRIHVWVCLCAHVCTWNSLFGHFVL